MGEKETGLGEGAGQAEEQRMHRPAGVYKELGRNPANDPDDDGDGSLDDSPVAVLKNKTKSNQSNDRLGQEYDPGATGAGAGGGPLEASNLNLSKSNINRTTIGDPDFDLADQKKMPERDKNVSQ